MSRRKPPAMAQCLNGQSKLGASVEEALEGYFEHMDGEEPNGLFDLLMHEVEVPMLRVVLKQTNGNQTQAARMLGINRGTLRKKLTQYGMD